MRLKTALVTILILLVLMALMIAIMTADGVGMILAIKDYITL
jgi:hypothetical protein